MKNRPKRFLILSALFLVLFSAVFLLAKNLFESNLKIQVGNEIQSSMDEKLFSDSQYVTSQRLSEFYLNKFNLNAPEFITESNLNLIIPEALRLDYVEVKLNETLPNYNSIENAFENKMMTSIRIKGIDRQVLFSYRYSIGHFPIFIFVFAYLLSFYFWVYRKE